MFNSYLHHNFRVSRGIHVSENLFLIHISENLFLVRVYENLFLEQVFENLFPLYVR